MKIMTLLLPLSFTFFLFNHPLSMGFNIIITTILISLTTGLMSPTFWFSYILFLVMIGGMLILFVYMTSVASNEKFKFSYKITTLFIMTLILTNMTNNSTNFMLKIQETMIFSSKMNSMIMNLKYFTPSLTLILISAMMYLLITLIMIVKITKKEKGPIRQK